MLPNFVNVDSLYYMYSCDRVTERRLDQVEEANCEAPHRGPCEFYKYYHTHDNTHSLTVALELTENI